MSLVLHLWERVVSASVVATFNRQMVIRLGSSHGIDLFLDGSENVGCGRIVVCQARSDAQGASEDRRD